MKPVYMTPDALMQFQRRHDLTNVSAALLFGYTAEHISNLRAGTTPIPKAVALLIGLIDSDHDLVLKVVANERKAQLDHEALS